MSENKNKKIKVLVLSDHPLAPSGVGTQTKYMIDALIGTGRYQFVCLGGAMKHDSTPLESMAEFHFLSPKAKGRSEDQS